MLVSGPGWFRFGRRCVAFQGNVALGFGLISVQWSGLRSCGVALELALLGGDSYHPISVELGVRDSISIRFGVRLCDSVNGRSGWCGGCVERGARVSMWFAWLGEWYF